MPLYLCSTPTDRLPPDARQRIATVITDVHCTETGAPRQFVHVVFFDREHRDVAERLMGSSMQDARCQLFGSIRSGRSGTVKQRLVDGMRGSVAMILNLDRSEVVMSTRDVDARWVMEGGALLPQPGEEAAWLARHSVAVSPR